MKTLFALIVFLIPVFALSNGVYKDIDFSENIREGSSQYRHLLEYNAKNESEGCSDKNWYIFSFNPDDQWLELSNGGWDADSNSLYNPQNLQEVNDLLVAFNQHETAETQLYICLVTDWKITLEAIHAEQLIQNQNPTIPINDFLNHFSNDSRTLFQDLIKLRFSNILRAILENVHQGQDYGQFTKVNRVVWGETEFRANFYFGQTKLSGGVLRYWDSLPDKMNTFINKEELLEYIGFIEGHRTYYGLNSREITVRSNVEGFTEFLTGNLDPAYVPLVDQLNFESMHYVPWETIPDHLKSQDGGEAFEAAVAVAVAEIALKKAQNQGIDLLLETPQHKFIINATTTDFSELTEKKMLMLDDKLAYLAHKSGLQFYLYFKRADFLMPPQQYNVFANRVFIESGLSELEEGAVLLCFPYFMPGEDILNVGGLNLTDLPSTMPGIACSPNLIGEDFYTEVNAVLAEGEMLWDLMTLVFKHTSKPHHIHGATLMLGNFREEDYASRLFLEDMTPPDQPELVTGYMNMNDLYLYKDKRIQTVLDLEAEKLT
ncbi:MAG: hypothetical protein KDC85_23220, partial [Saprospiraceae bacterium]|nr:hypothetical protein [Saprospiraceae bacterium]